MFGRTQHHRRRFRQHQRSNQSDDESSVSSSSDSSSSNRSDAESNNKRHTAAKTRSMSTKKKTIINLSSFSSESSSESEEEERVEEKGQKLHALKARSLINEDSDASSSSDSSNDSDDEDEDPGNINEYMSGDAIKREIQSHSRLQIYDNENETPQEPSTQSSSRPLPAWKDSESKARIIENLKNENSSIHALIAPAWESNLDALWKKYAPQYQRSKFRGYMKTILESYKEKKGPFKNGYVNAVHSSDSPTLAAWDKSKSRKRIVEDLMDYRSTIHELIEDWEKEENLTKLWQEYASEYQLSKFRGYMKTIMKNFRAKKGEFKERWYATKNGCNSVEYSLLYTLMVNDDIAGVSTSIIDSAFLFLSFSDTTSLLRYLVVNR